MKEHLSEKKIVFPANITLEQWERISEVASQNGMSKSAVARWAIDCWIDMIADTKDEVKRWSTKPNAHGMEVRRW